MHKVGILIGLFISIGLFLPACYQSPEGCRDIHALNYDVKADKDCEDDCCKYPTLQINVSHLYEGEALDTSSYFDHPSIDSVRIKYMVYYLSDFRFYNGLENDSAKILEHIEVGQKTEDITEYISYPFSVAKIKLERAGIYELGSFSQADLYSSLEFDFGIKDAINFGDQSRIVKTSHPLYQNQDSMYIHTQEGFYFLKMAVEIKDIREIAVSMKGADFRIPLTVNKEFDFRERAEREIDMSIHYDLLLENINFIADNEEMIAQKIFSNVENSLVFE